MALGRGNIEVGVRATGLSDSIAREVRTAERNIRPLSVSLDDKGFRQPLGRITGDLGEFQNALDASVARTLAFGAAVGVINSMANAFKGMVTAAIEVEKTLADVNVILNLTSAGLVNFSANLFQVAQNTGQSFQTVSEAAIELARQGLGAEESLKRINDAMILTRLSGMDATKSVASLTAAVNSFASTAITTAEVVNKLASVDAAFAVSTDDLANALSRAGASAQGAKVDMDQLLAAVTSVQQTTARGGAVIGNAFKSIFTRLQRGGVRQALEEIGVATMDAAGNIRGAMDVLQDYSQVYGTLSDSQRAYTDELIAGVFQINNLKALMKDLGSDYSIYTRALKQSAGATDEAERRNKSLQTTLAALVNESVVSVTQLASALGGLVATPAIENLLKVFNSVAGALSKALDPEEGSKLIKGMFGTIGKFISGPGLIIVGLAFVKLFKFITGQSVKAVQEVFKINTAKQKTAQIEAQITSILKSNNDLYERISNESLTHEQREEMVLDTLQAQTLEYKQQAAMISRLGSSRSVGTAVKGVVAAAPSRAEGFIPRYAGGYIPNFANGMEGAVEAERKAITAGEGGASPGAQTKVLNNFPIGGGRNETMVANTDEVIVPKFGGSSGSAIFNKDMIKKGGMPEGAIPVARGWIPNFALKGAGATRAAQKEKSQAGKSSLLSDPEFSQFWNGSGLGTGTLEVNTQEATSGFGIIGGRGSPGLGKAGLKGPFANEALKSNFKKLAQGRMSINSREAEEFMKLFSKRKTNFTNIPVNTVSNEPITRKDGESMLTSPISTMIQPYMADAVEKVSTQIYSNYFPRDFDTAGYIAGVRSAVDKDKEIVSRSVEGGILESALKLGTTESAKNIGADESATWDFEPAGAIPGYLKKNFFDGKKVIRADAKRTVNDEERGKVLKKATDEVFPAQLSAGILDSIGGKVLARAKKSFNRKKGKADGFIPSFVTSIPSDLTAAGYKAKKSIAPFGGKSVLSKASVREFNPPNYDGVLRNSGKKTDLFDKFSGLIVPEFQQMDIGQYTMWSQKVAGKMFTKMSKGSKGKPGVKELNEPYIKKWIKRYKEKGADDSKLKSLRTALTNIKPGNQNGYRNILSTIKGIMGEVTAARARGTTVAQKNAPFDLVTGEEVKTIAKPQSARDILRKAAALRIKGLSLKNKKLDKVPLPDTTVILPRDGRLAAASGFIPNFANSVDEAISREREALQAQGSSAQIYTDTDPRVAGPQNPAGLLVANTRDEPRGGSQGVERVMKQGADPRTNGAANGFIPNFVGVGGVGRIFKKTAGGIGMLTNQLETLTFKIAGAEAVLMTMNGAFEAFGSDFRVPSLTGFFTDISLGLRGVKQPLIDISTAYTEAIEKQIKAMEMATEQVDKFAGDTALLGKAVKAGDLEAAGKFAQKLYMQLGEVEDIDPSKLNELMQAAGNPEAIAKATDALKNDINARKSMLNFSRDFASKMQAVEAEAGNDQGKRTSLIEEMGKDGTFQGLAKTLTKGLDVEQLASVGKKLKGLTVDSANLSQVLGVVEAEVGPLPEGFKRLANANREMGEEFLTTIQAQADYAAGLKRVQDALKEQTSTTTNLIGRIQSLGSAMQAMAENTAAAQAILSDVADIKFKSNLDTAQATGTVTKTEVAQATADNESTRSLTNAAQEQSNAIKQFVSKTLQGTEGNEGKLMVLQGPLASLIKSVQDGRMDNNAALKAVSEIGKVGSAEEKKSAKELIQTLRSTNKAQIAEQMKIAANLEATKLAINTQAVAFARNNQTSKGQLDQLKNIDKNFKTSDGTRKSSLEKITELNATIKTIEQLGGTNTQEMLSEMKESNAQLSQLENFRAQFEALAGDGGIEGGFDASSLVELEQQVREFISGGSFRDLGDNARILSMGLKEALEESIDTGAEAPEDLARPEISAQSITELANALGEAVSDPLRELLGVDADTVDSLDSELDVDTSAIATEIGELNAQNKDFNTQNSEILAQQNTIIMEALTKGINDSDLGNSSQNLALAAQRLDSAATKIEQENADRGGGNAGGFVPSFSKNGEQVAKAIKAERQLGGRPVVDSHPSVGTYVRDGNTQSNFASVRRDHPEGLQQATKNSARIQGAIAADGLVPNYSTKTTGKIITSSLKVGFEGAELAARASRKASVPKLKLKPDSGGSNLDTFDVKDTSDLLSKFDDAGKAIKPRFTGSKADLDDGYIPGSPGEMTAHLESVAKRQALMRVKAGQGGKTTGTAKSKIDDAVNDRLLKMEKKIEKAAAAGDVEKKTSLIRKHAGLLAKTGLAVGAVATVGGLHVASKGNEIPEGAPLPGDDGMFKGTKGQFLQQLEDAGGAGGMSSEAALDFWYAHKDRLPKELNIEQSQAIQDLLFAHSSRGLGKSFAGNWMDKKTGSTVMSTFIKDLGSNRPEVTKAAYFGGKFFAPNDSRGESADYPSFIETVKKSKEFESALRNLSYLHSEAGSHPSMTSTGRNSVEGFNSTVLKSIGTAFQGGKDRLFKPLTQDVGSLVSWNGRAPHNNDPISDAFVSLVDAVAIAASLASFVFPPAAIVAVPADVLSIATQLGISASGMGKSGADGVMGDLLPSNAIDYYAASSDLYDEGFFHEQAQTLGIDMAKAPRGKDDLADAAFITNSIQMERQKALWEAYSAQKLEFTPGLMKADKSTSLQLSAEQGTEAGYNLAGFDLKEKIGEDVAGLEAAGKDLSLVGTLPGGPRFITDTSMVSSLMKNFTKEPFRLNLPLDLSSGENPSIRLQAGSSGGWEPAMGPRSWSGEELEMVKQNIATRIKQVGEDAAAQSVTVAGLKGKLEKSAPRAISDPNATEEDIAARKRQIRSYEANQVKIKEDFQNASDLHKGLVDEKGSLRSAQEMTNWYIRAMGGFTGETAMSWLKKPQFPDPGAQKQTLSFESLINDKTMTASRRDDVIKSPKANNDPEAEMTGFLQQLFDEKARANATYTKDFIEGRYSPNTSTVISLFNPPAAIEGYAEAEKELNNTRDFINQTLEDNMVEKRNRKTNELTDGADNQQTDALFTEALDRLNAEDASSSDIERVQQQAKVRAAQGELLDEALQSELNLGSELIGPRAPRGPAMVAADIAAGERTQTAIEEIRDGVYMRILGQQATDKRAQAKQHEEATIERLQRVQETSGDYEMYLRAVIERKKKTRIGQQKQADKFAGTGQADKKEQIVSQTDDEIDFLEARADMMVAGDDSWMAHLFYMDGTKPSTVNGRQVAPSLWDSPSSSVQDYQELINRLGLDESDAEKRLAELRSSEDPKDQSLMGQIGLNWSQHLTDTQKSRSLGGYGFFAQIRNQKGNAGAQAFKNQFSTMSPEDRLLLMQELGVRTSDLGQASYEDLIAQEGGLKDGVKAGLMNFAGQQNPAFGFLLDQIFAGGGSTEESDLILNTIKGLGIPFNDMAPVDQYLKGSEVNIRTPNSPNGANVKALPDGDISALMDYLYKEQFDNWAEQNKEKMGKDGPDAGIAYLDEIIGGTSMPELMKFPSFLRYLNDGGMTDLPKQIEALLLDPDEVVNYGAWSDLYEGGTLKPLKYLSDNTGYGAFQPKSTLSDIPFIDGKGINEMSEIFGDQVTNEKQAATVAMGETLSHGRNRAIEALLNPQGNPFPALDSHIGRAEGIADISAIAESIVPATKTALYNYAPFGYSPENKAQSPMGSTREKIESLTSLIQDKYKDKDDDLDLTKISKEKMPQNLKAAPLNVGEKLARGFVPNFMEVLAEKTGIVERVTKDGKKYVKTGTDGSAIITNPDGTLVGLPSSSSYLSSSLESQPGTESTSTLPALGIPTELVKILSAVDESTGKPLDESQIRDIDVGSMVFKLKKLKKESSLNINGSSSQAGIRGASGFVPNFSSIAGEIAASQAAGYKSPVTPSQVKTMNIPGAGKAAYNTQESVFKMPGVVQPFIRPPQTSDAAPSYAKEVRKKYNFNPYQNAAAGFVPNFKGGVDTAALERAINSFSSGTENFGENVGKFSAAVNNLDFSILEKAATEMSGASKTFTSQYKVLADAAGKIQEGANKISEGSGGDLNIKPLTSAAGDILTGVGNLEAVLNQPLTLQTQTLEDTMNALTAALRDIQGEIQVQIADVTINVQGAGDVDLSDSTKKAIAEDMKAVVSAKIQEETPGIISDYMG